MGGDGGNVYLLDYEELKKAMNDATGSTVQQKGNIYKNGGSSAIPLLKQQ